MENWLFNHFLSLLHGPLSFYTALENYTIYLQQSFRFRGGKLPLRAPMIFCIFFNKFNKPCVNFLLVWTKNANLENFEKILKNHQKIWWFKSSLFLFSSSAPFLLNPLQIQSSSQKWPLIPSVISAIKNWRKPKMDCHLTSAANLFMQNVARSPPIKLNLSLLCAKWLPGYARHAPNSSP